MNGETRPGRWVWVPETDQEAQESLRRLKEWTTGHGFSETGARIFRELRNQDLPPERRAELHDELITELERKSTEWAAGSAQRRAARREAGIGTYGWLT